LQLDTAPTAGKLDRQPKKQPRKPLQFAGLPLAFWILAAAGVALAIGLGIAVFNK
jgi:hypothetical protein